MRRLSVLATTTRTISRLRGMRARGGIRWLPRMMAMSLILGGSMMAARLIMVAPPVSIEMIGVIPIGVIMIVPRYTKYQVMDQYYHQDQACQGTHQSAR